MRDRVNPEMLILARESRGFSQTELASDAGVTQTAISKFESGLLPVPEDRVKDLATALSYPPEFFYLPERRYGYGSTCLFHRKRQSMPIRQLRQIHATMNVIRIQVSRLLAGVEIQHEAEFPRFDIDEHESPEQIAQYARSSWRLPIGPVEDLIGLIEQAGGVVMRQSFGNRKLDAVSQWPPGQHPFFFVNGDIPIDRLRWTLAHEIGHVIMHTIPTDQQEREADRFAAEFLMPANEIRTDLRGLSTKIHKFVPLKLYWRVSIKALIVHAYNLGELTQSQYRRLLMLYNKMGYNAGEPAPLQIEQPRAIREVLNVHRREHGYSVRDLSRLAAATEKDFRSTFLSEEPPEGLRLVTP